MINPAGAVPGNSQNAPTANTPRTRSTFPLKYHLFDTHRFGEYHPHYVEDSVKNDVLPIRSSHNVMSYTLKSPLMQSITMKKDYFSVPMEAILPNNWEKFFDNPVRGDDVSDDVGPTVENFWAKVGNFTYALWQALGTIASDSTTYTPTQLLQACFRFLVVSEYFYSNGSLMTSLGCHGASYVSINDGNYYRDFDLLFDSFVRKILSAASLVNGKLFNMTVDGYTYDVAVDYDEANRDFISLNHALALMRDNPTFVINSLHGTWTNLFQAVDDVISDYTFVPTVANVPFNTSRLWAYQLCCAHYFTNDHIDFVYSAELYRQLIGNYLIMISNTGALPSSMYFIRNGVTYAYDYLSAHSFTFALGYAYSASNALALLTGNSSRFNGLLGYLSALFAYRRSLRYLDYFTGSRAQPLAVGSTGVSVVNNTVDVVDVTRNIQRQRFLNAVNRVRHTAEGYLQGIFGGDVPAPDYHNPFFLAHTDDTIFGDETANTGAAQVDTTRPIAVTTNLRSNGSRYMLEIHSDRPCIVIGITHYDLPRVYGHSMERPFLHVDRFDMFNPFMQFVGDQPVYLQELGIKPNSSILTSMTNFSYSLRNMEYKQRYSQAAGAFVSNLPGWCFLTLDRRGDQSTINPDWIRSVPAEIDQFYNTLTGYSLGTYFHFIVDTFNDCSGSRPMAYAPSIL